MKTDKNSRTTTAEGRSVQPERASPSHPLLRLRALLGLVPQPHKCHRLTPRSHVIQGDCVQQLRQLRAGSVDFVLTDPPYLVKYKDRQGRTVHNDDNADWILPAFAEVFRVLKPNSYCVSFYGSPRVEEFMTAWKQCGFQPVGHFVWVKRYSSCVRHTQFRHEQAYLLAKGKPLPPKNPPADVLSWHYTGNVLHPTQKPVGSLAPLIEAYSPYNGVVLDPFAGSGTTGIAALRSRRRCVLIEKDAIHSQTMRRRLEQSPHHLGTSLVSDFADWQKLLFGRMAALIRN